MPAFFVPLAEIAALTQGTLLGRPDLVITGVAGLSEAGADDLSFVTGEAASKEATSTRAVALLVPRPINGLACAQIVVTNPALAMAQVVEKFFVPQRPAFGVSKLVSRGYDVVLGEGVSIWPFVTLDDRVSIGRGTTLYPNVFVGEGGVIGEDCVIYPNVTIRERVTIGNRVIIHSGTVVGSDGFGFAKRADGRWHKIMQNAPVIIEDDVEIQANSCIDRATVGETRIRRGAKIDDLVLVGHACEVGEDAILCGQVGLAGSTRVGNRCILAGQVGSAGHLDIGDGAIITAQSGMHLDVPPGTTWSGSPVMENKLYLRVIAALKRLPDIQKRVRRHSGELDRKKTADK